MICLTIKRLKWEKLFTINISLQPGRPRPDSEGLLEAPISRDSRRSRKSLRTFRRRYAIRITLSSSPRYLQEAISNLKRVASHTNFWLSHSSRRGWRPQLALRCQRKLTHSRISSMSTVKRSWRVIKGIWIWKESRWTCKIACSGRSIISRWWTRCRRGHRHLCRLPHFHQQVTCPWVVTTTNLRASYL